MEAVATQSGQSTPEPLPNKLFEGRKLTAKMVAEILCQ